MVEKLNLDLHRKYSFYFTTIIEKLFYRINASEPSDNKSNEAAKQEHLRLKRGVYIYVHQSVFYKKSQILKMVYFLSIFYKKMYQENLRDDDAMTFAAPTP